MAVDSIDCSARIFDTYFADQSLNDLGTLTDVLLENAHALRALQSRCMIVSQRALQAGNHIEGRRLSDLARHINRFATKLNASNNRPPTVDAI